MVEYTPDLYKGMFGPSEVVPEDETVTTPKIEATTPDIEVNPLYQGMFGSSVAPKEDEEEQPTTPDRNPLFEELYTGLELGSPEPTFETPEEADNAEKLTYAQLSSDEEYIDMLREYMTDRLGGSGEQKEDESNEDYLKRFVSHARRFEWNSVKLGQQLSWVRNANEEERAKFGYLYTQLDRLPSFYQEGGAGFAPALRDFGGSLLFDPLTYIGFGTGAVASRAATRAVVETLKASGKKQAIEQAARYSTQRMLGTGAGRLAATGLVAEAGLTAAQDRALQEIEKLAYGKEIDPGRMLLAGGLGLGLGGIGTAISGGLSPRRILRSATGEVARETRALRRYTNRERQFARDLKNKDREAINTAIDSADAATSRTATGIFNLDEGRQTLRALGNVEDTNLTQAEFNINLMQRVGKVVTETVAELAENGKLGQIVDADTKASEVIGVITSRLAKARLADDAAEVSEQTKRMLEGGDGELGILSKLDFEDEGFDAAIEAAISRAGITVEQFVNAMGASYSNAGRFLQTSVNVGKIIKRLGRLDKNLEDILLEVDNVDRAAGFMGRAMEFVRRLDRERRALMVSQVATTVRNIATGGARITMETAADLMESAIYQLGRGTHAARIGNPDVGGGKWMDILKDGFGKLHRLRTSTNTKTLVDGLLNHNRTLATRMDRTLQEVSDDEVLSKITTNLNTLNIAQDQFFRRAIFVNSINKKLKRAGVIVDNPTRSGQFASLDEFVASGKTLPGSVLSDSIDEALEFTFSRMPKGNEFGARFVKFTESVGPLPLPITNTIMFPFARFMVNALKFQYEFSPFGALSAMTRNASGNDLQKMANAATKISDKTKLGRQAAGEFQKAREATSKAAMGTAAFAAAVYHRFNNQDLKFYEYRTEDGGTGDLRPYFPLTPYLAVADFFVKSFNNDLAKADVKELVAGITGVQARTGASSYILDKAGELANSTFGGQDSPSTERMNEFLGKLAAEYGGSYLTPARIVRDVIASYNTEEATLRDVNQADGKFFTAFSNVIKKNLPGLSRQLPAFQSPTRASDVFRERSLMGQLGLPRYEAKRNPAEEEMVRLGIPRYTVGAREGDRTADAYVNEAMGEYTEDFVVDLVNSERYQNLSDVQKRAALSAELNRVRGVARDIGEMEARMDQERDEQGISTSFDRGRYNRLNGNEISLINEYYMEKYGKSVAEMVEEEPNVNHYKRATELARILFRTVGTVQEPVIN